MLRWPPSVANSSLMPCAGSNPRARNSTGSFFQASASHSIRVADSRLGNSKSRSTTYTRLLLKKISGQRCCFSLIRTASSDPTKPAPPVIRICTQLHSGRRTLTDSIRIWREKSQAFAKSLQKSMPEIRKSCLTRGLQRLQIHGSFHFAFGRTAPGRQTISESSKCAFTAAPDVSVVQYRAARSDAAHLSGEKGRIANGPRSVLAPHEIDSVPQRSRIPAPVLESGALPTEKSDPDSTG